MLNYHKVMKAEPPVDSSRAVVLKLFEIAYHLMIF